MKLNDLMVRDIRAEIDLEGDKIIIKNPKGEVKKELLLFFEDQVNRNADNAASTKGRKKKIATDMDILKTLMIKLTNIQVDIDDMREVLSNPSHELSLVMLYLSSIMQELIFEVLANKNVAMRMQKNTLLEKDTLNMIADIEGLITEIKHRKLMENGEEIVQ